MSGTANDDHARLHELLGSYALGQLSDADAAEVEAHVATCPECTADLDFVASAAAALGDLRGSTPVLDEAVPADLGDRVVARVDAVRRSEQRARFLRVAGVTSVAAAVAAIALVAGLRLTQTEAPVAAPVIPLEKVPVVDRVPTVQASAAVVPHTWGMEVKLHATGFTTGQRYVVLVKDLDGTDHDAGEFVGTGTRPMDCNLNSSVLRAQASGFEVRDAAGTVLVTSTF